jgi:uncharacterized HAD superfamily protein
MKRVLGVDFDDVLVKSGEALARFHNKEYGTSYTKKDVTTYDLSDIWKCTPEEARRRIDEFVSSDFHREADAVFGAYDSLKLLSDFYDIAIVTGRREREHRDRTVEWLTENFLGLYREIHFTSHDDPDLSRRRLKSDVVKELGISAFIDDARGFAADVAASGVPVLLFDTPWNQGAVPKGVTRVFSWEEIVSHLAPKAP